MCPFALLLLVGIAGVLTPGVDSLSAPGTDLVRDAYAPYERGCRDGGALADRGDFCAETLEQRDRIAASV